MPLNRKGMKILREMIKKYGKEEGEEIFYKSINAGTIKGVH